MKQKGQRFRHQPRHYLSSHRHHRRQPSPNQEKIQKDEWLIVHRQNYHDCQKPGRLRNTNLIFRHRHKWQLCGNSLQKQERRARHHLLAQRQL
jgi:hypothetical protein